MPKKKTKLNIKKKSIANFPGGNFGNYAEDTGGGKPFDTSNTRTTRANGKYRQQNNKTSQPRTNDGKFTYKSVNGKSIDPKYGPSRGTTVNPLLTGGKNGVQIDDVQAQFSQKSDTASVKNQGYWSKYKDSWYIKGSEKIAVSAGKKHKEDLHTHISAATIWDIAKEYHGGEFTTGKISESKNWEEVKKGKRSAAENAALQKTKQTGEEQYVQNPDGSIKLAPGYKNIGMPTPKPQPRPRLRPTAPTPSPVPTPRPQPQPTVSAPTSSAPVQAGTTDTGDDSNYKTKYTSDQIDSAKKLLLDEYGIGDEYLEGLSEKELDDIIDAYISFDEEESQDSNDAADNNATDNSDNSENSEQDTQEEDSDLIKKIKSMGFDK